MAYGENLPQLNPLPPALIMEALARFCPPGATVADIGCGRGTTLAWLREHSCYELRGVEADPDYAAASGIASGAACGVALGRAEDLPWAADSLDAALLECVFSLLDDPERALSEIGRVLRPGGVLLLSDLYGKAGSAETSSALLRHIYSREQVEEILSKAGFTCLGFTDHTFELHSLLAQMIMDGTACACLEPADRLLLKQVRAGYGLWVFRWEEE